MSQVRRAPWLGSLLLAAAGCAQNGPILSHRATLGSLKTSVSQLEFENRQLRHQVDTLKADNRTIEDRLVQEETLNGELTARLDDARAVISQRGGSTAGLDVSSPDRDRPTPRTVPAAQKSRKPRKPPFAQIPGRVDTLPAEPPDDEAAEPIKPQSGWKGDPGPQTSSDHTGLWMPIARSSGPKPQR